VLLQCWSKYSHVLPARGKGEQGVATLSVGKLSGKITFLRTDLKIKTTPAPEQYAEVTCIISTVHSIGVKVRQKSSFNGKTDKSETTRERESTVHQKERHFGVRE